MIRHLYDASYYSILWERVVGLIYQYMGDEKNWKL